MLVRQQVVLKDTQLKLLRSASKKLGVSISALLRYCINNTIAHAKISPSHDEMLFAEADAIKKERG